MKTIFDRIENQQDKALAIGDLSTAIKLNWLKYSIDSLSNDEITYCFQSIIINNKMLIEEK
jgi:hypothetical protein